MGYLYHGSFIRGLKKLEPRNSTHGKYVYATPTKELALHFSKRCGDDLTYSLYRTNRNEPYNLVERIPYGFETMYSNSSSLYTINDDGFKDVHTGFDEVVSDKSVDVISEEYIENVYEEIQKLEKNGVVKLYHYPNKPKDIPQDNSDLIDKILNRYTKNSKPIPTNVFDRLLYLHPYLLDQVNKRIDELGLEITKYTKEDLVSLFEKRVLLQIEYPEKEEFLKSSVTSIIDTFPELTQEINDKLSTLNKDKKDNITNNWIESSNNQINPSKEVKTPYIRG